MNFDKYNQPSPDLKEGLPSKMKGELLECKERVMGHIPVIATNPTILDVGPAGGWETIRLNELYSYRETPKVTAISLFKEEVENLKNITKAESFVMDMHELARGWNNKFDLVFASHVLEHSHSPYIAMSEFHRVLNKNKICFIVLPNADGYTGLHRERPTRIGGMKAHIFIPSIDTMIEMARHVGFTFEAYHEEPQWCGDLIHYINRIFIFRK